MKFRITESDRNDLSFLPVPQNLAHYKIFDNCLVASGHFGNVISQQQSGNGFTIVYLMYLITNPSRFFILNDEPVIKLQVALKSKLDYYVDGLGNVHFNENQFNVGFLPVLNISIDYIPGEYDIFFVEFSKEYLQRFEPFLPQVKKFIDNVESRVPCYLNKEHHYSDVGMKEVLKQILHGKFSGGLGEIYLETKVAELLTLAISSHKQSEDDSKIRLTKEETDKIMEVAQWIEKNETTPENISKLSRRFLINEHKLRKGFKQVLGMTVFEYLLKIRMEKAKKLLQETNHSVTEIAFLTGFGDVHHFSKTFKKFYGVPPLYLRKK